MHFWFNVKKTKHAWFVDFCLFKSSIFPESFFDSHSMDGDRHIGQVVPVPPAPPAFVVPNLEKDKEREREEREREERERHIDKEIKENEIKRRSRGNDLRIDDNGTLFLPSFLKSIFLFVIFASFPY